MKNQTLLLILVLFLLSVPYQQTLNGTSGVSVSSGLVLLFGMNNQIKCEISGETASVGGSGISDRFSKQNEAIYFNGNNQYVSLGHNKFKATEVSPNLSICVWVYTKRPGGVIWDNRSYNTNDEHGWHLQLDNSGKVVFMSGDNDGNDCDWLGNDDCRVKSSFQVPKNTWTHICIAKSYKNIKFYQNGAYQNNANVSRNGITYNDGNESDHRYIGTASDEDFYDGSFGYTTARYFYGSLDEIRIYNRQISDSEVTQIFNYAPTFQCDKSRVASSLCSSCKGDRQLSNGICSCPAGKHDDNSSQNCQDCNYKCATCSGSSTSCDSCKDAGNRTKANCGCKDGYYDDGTSICKECSYKCATCVGSADSCASCSDVSNRKNDPTCACNTGYYEKQVQTELCGKCDHSCSTCEETSVKCKLCSHVTRIFDSSNNSCPCQNGFYDANSRDECYECNFICQKCSNSASNCDQCADTTTRKMFPSCLCKDSYFQESNNVLCSKCIDICGTCESNANNCLTCVNETRDVNKSCGCKDGYYDISDLTCGKCAKQCGTCENQPDNCQTCSDVNRDPANNCECKDGFFQNGEASICGTCDHQCGTCFGTSDGCESCSDSNRTLGDDKKCECQIGWFDNGVSTCAQCSHQCGSCTGTADNCTACSDLDNRYLNSRCNCKLGFYDVALQNQCLKCDESSKTNPVCAQCLLPGCLICQSDSVCDTCKISVNPARLGLSDNCACPKGYYDNNEDEQCQKCPYGCTECSDENTCSECAVSQNARDISTLCACPTGYFDDGVDECSQCQPDCVSCSDGQKCDTCAPSTPEKVPERTCGCPNGYYDAGSQVCLQCMSSCETCVNDTECVTCKTSNPERTGNKCGCNQNGYFDDKINDQCQQCAPGCLKCDDLSQCTSCKTSINPVRSGSNCECDTPGYYDDLLNEQCAKCHHKCGTCTGQVEQCLTCSDDSRDSITCECVGDFWEKGIAKCQEGCPIGYYHVGEHECEKCSPQCKTCESLADLCISCEIGFQRNLLAPLCGCSEGYYQANDMEGNLHCKQCESKCKSCDNSGSCQVCLNESLIAPLCKQSFVGYCTTTGNTKGDVLSQDGNKVCDKKCSKCLNESSNCLQCAIELHRLDQAPECGCEEGYYSHPDFSDCQACPKGCRSCKDANSCLTCEDIQNKQINKFTGQCECKQGYVQDFGSNKCNICFIFEGECFQQCPSQTVQNEEEFTCEMRQKLVQGSSLIYYGMSFVYVLISALAIVVIVFLFKNSIRISKLRAQKHKIQKLGPDQQQEPMALKKLSDDSDCSDDNNNKVYKISMEA